MVTHQLFILVLVVPQTIFRGGLFFFLIVFGHSTLHYDRQGFFRK